MAQCGSYALILHLMRLQRKPSMCPAFDVPSDGDGEEGGAVRRGVHTQSFLSWMATGGFYAHVFMVLAFDLIGYHTQLPSRSRWEISSLNLPAPDALHSRVWCWYGIADSGQVSLSGVSFRSTYPVYLVKEAALYRWLAYLGFIRK